MLIRVNRSEIPLLQQYNKNVRYLPNGFTEVYKPMDKVECRKLLGLPLNEQFVFAYGVFDERKGFQVLIDSMSYVNAKDPSIKCYISGSGPYKPYLEKFIYTLRLKNNISTINYLDDKYLVVWINAADLFIFPSLRESFGITQVNALACGVPVIASKNVGSKEIICDK
jgi:glycosyltransferase involved in cell wall biosynthesis